MNYLNRFRRSTFIRNVATLSLGTVIAQILNLLITPILSRLYQPEDYSTFALFTSIVAQIGVVASLRLELALPTISNDEEAVGLIILALKIIAITVIVSFLGIMIALDLKGEITDQTVFYLIPIAVFFSSTSQVLNFLSTRQQTFGYNSVSRIIVSASTGLISILLGWINWGASGLIFGFIIGSATGMIVLWNGQKKTILSRNLQRSNYKTSHYIKKFRQFIFINTPHAFIDTLESLGILLLMNSIYEPKDIGSYFFAYRILQLPVNLIGAAVFQVFYQKLSKAKIAGEFLAPKIRSVYLFMTYLGLPIFIFLFFFAKKIFPLVFGTEWEQSGILASTLTPWLFFNFIASSVSSITMILNRQQYAITIAIFNLSIRILILLFLGKTIPFDTMVGLLTTVSSIMMIFAAWWYHYIAQKHDLLSIDINAKQ